jgi:hypothetical protein
MYRHELRFVLRFGAQQQFHEFARRLYAEEVARGWTPPRIWHSISGLVNQIVIEHDCRSAEAFRKERDEFHAVPGEVGAVLAQLADLVVPGTAVQFDLDGVVPETDA